MHLVIIADIHDNLANLGKCLNWCQQNSINQLICLGDLTTSETLDFLATHFPGEIFMISGNGEIYAEAELNTYPHIHFYSKVGLITLEGLKIGLVHEKWRLKKLFADHSSDLYFVFYGHSHAPGLEKNGPTIIANPGNLAGTFHQATFATLDTETGRLELKILAEL